MSDVYSIYGRKQLYLEETQDRALKRRAKALGVSEAELVRRALASVLSEGQQRRGASDALSDLFAEADKVAAEYQFTVPAR